MRRSLLLKLSALSLGMMLSDFAFATQILIDFDSGTYYGPGILAGTVESQGFDFTSEHFHISSHSDVEYGVIGDGQYLVGDGYRLGRPVIMAEAGGGTFSLLGLDTSRLWLNDEYASYGFVNGDYLNIFAYQENGSTISVDIQFNDVVSFAHFDLADFTNLTSVVFSAVLPGVTDNASWAVDNILVDTDPVAPVPEPTTLLLLGAGLVGLAGYGRRRNK